MSIQPEDLPDDMKVLIDHRDDLEAQADRIRKQWEEDYAGIEKRLDELARSENIVITRNDMMDTITQDIIDAKLTLDEAVQMFEENNEPKDS